MPDHPSQASNPGKGLQGEIAEGDAFSRGTALAGVLAEHGVTSLVLRRGSATERLACRSTDLPGRLVEADSAFHPTPLALESEDLSILVEPTRLCWSTSRVTLARALRALA